MGRKTALALGVALIMTILPLSALPALAETPSVQVTQDANLGTILTGPNGMTLYRFTKDTPGVSNCYDQCAVNWPPLLLGDGQSVTAPAGLNGTLGTTTRKDGSVQVTYDGWPLYYWYKDKQPGDTTGQNVGKVWFVLNSDAPIVKLSQDATLGMIMTDANGMTLYVFTKDAPGTTNCYGQCAVNWPPLLLKSGELLNAPAGLAGKLGTTTRTDGSLQVTFNGAPLYYWIKDKAAGQTTGHKVGGVWFVAQPGLLLDAAGTWAQAQIDAAVSSGWLSGNAGGYFQPNSGISRADFMSALAHALGAPAGQAAPDQPLTREDAIAAVARALGLTGSAGSQTLDRFSDASQLQAENVPLVAAAVEQGLVQGYPDKTIRGSQSVSRAEAAVLITRALALKK